MIEFVRGPRTLKMLFTREIRIARGFGFGLNS